MSVSGQSNPVRGTLGIQVPGVGRLDIRPAVRTPPRRANTTTIPQAVKSVNPEKVVATCSGC
jgi:hypothetical protein